MRLAGETGAALQDRIAATLSWPPNLICYVQLHEFEAFLLSDAAIAARYFDAAAMRGVIDKAVRDAGLPEMVNDGPFTGPSKRLEDWTTQHAPVLLRFSKQTKVRHGAALAIELILETIRDACPLFGAWLRRLETLGQPPATR